MKKRWLLVPLVLLGRTGFRLPGAPGARIRCGSIG